MEKQELDDKIKEFCEKKHFENPFVQECITEFIKGHTELYGDIIPAEKLFERLEDNLDKITFKDEVNINKAIGEYKGRIADNTDVNEISIYFPESYIELSEDDKKIWDIYREIDKKELLEKLRRTKKFNQRYIIT